MKNLLTLICLTWATILSAQVYQSAESVEYDPVNQQWIVSNSGNMIADDGAGNLSFFGTGQTGFGLEVLGNVIFGIDGSTVRGFDLNTEMEVASVSVPGAGFLNGMTNDGASNLYVTDFSGQKIYKIDVSDLNNLSVEEMVSNTGSTPNGIVYDGANNRLIFVNWNASAAIKAVDLSDNSVSTVITTGLGNIDGIDEDNDGNYYISSWLPNQISKFDKDFANPLEVITTPFIDRPADIGYSLQTDSLAIPIGNDVVFVSFATPDTMATAVQHLSAEEVAFLIHPNPVSQVSYIQFDLAQSNTIQLQILDQQGRVVRTLLEGTQASGQHKVLFAGHDLPAGVYFCQLHILGVGQVTERMMVIK